MVPSLYWHCWGCILLSDLTMMWDMLDGVSGVGGTDPAQCQTDFRRVVWWIRWSGLFTFIPILLTNFCLTTLRISLLPRKIFSQKNWRKLWYKAALAIINKSPTIVVGVFDLICRLDAIKLEGYLSWRRYQFAKIVQDVNIHSYIISTSWNGSKAFFPGRWEK